MMNSKTFLFFILIFLSLKLFAYEVGSGSEYKFTLQNQKVDLSIYIASVEQKKLNVEMHFGAGDLIITNMWQQFEFNLNKNAPLTVSRGYIQAGVNKKPEIMDKDSFKLNRGVQLEDFLFSKESEINAMLVGEENIELIAGSIIAKHYRKISNGQTVDFWIASSVAPIGLVKLISKSESSPENNYSLELSSLIKNVSPTIIPNNAVPMSSETSKKLKLIR